MGRTRKRVILALSFTLAVMILYSHSAHEEDKDENVSFELLSNVYVLPGSYHPSVYGSDGFAFYLNFPQAGIGKAGPTPSNSIHVRVFSRKLRSDHERARLMKDIGPVGVISGFDVYEERIGKNGQTKLTHYTKTDTEGWPIVITQAESLNYRACRAINNNIELDYVFDKELGISEWEKLDKLILQTFSSFRQLPK